MRPLSRTAVMAGTGHGAEACLDPFFARGSARDGSVPAVPPERAEERVRRTPDGLLRLSRVRLRRCAVPEPPPGGVRDGLPELSRRERDELGRDVRPLKDGVSADRRTCHDRLRTMPHGERLPGNRDTVHFVPRPGFRGSKGAPAHGVSGRLYDMSCAVGVAAGDV